MDREEEGRAEVTPSETWARTGSKKEGADVTQSETGLWTGSKKEGSELTHSVTRAVDRK